MQISPLISYFTVAIFGLAFGSFLNVCIVRLPRQESIITPRSHCPRCGKPIRWYDNIPVLSYLFLRGRCRDCREPISLIYPTVEILTAGFVVAAWARYGFTPEFVKYAVLGMLLLVLVFTDLTARRIPHAVTRLGIGLGLLLSFVVPVDNRPLEWLLGRFDFYLEGTFSSVLGSVVGALLGGGLLYGVCLAFQAFYRWLRLPKPFQGVVHCKCGDQEFESVGRNITESGMSIESPGEISVGEEWKLEFELPDFDGSFQVRTRVLREEHSDLVVVSFVDLTPRQRKSIRQYNPFLGFGDVMLMLMVGTFLGVPLTYVSITLGTLAGALVAVPSRIASERFRSFQWPYGSFLGAAAIYASLGGQALLDAYLRWSGLAG